MEHLFQCLFWLKEGLNTGQWRVYERKEEPSGGVCLVLSTDLRSAASLERMKWCPFNGVGQVTFSLGAKLEERRLEEGPIGDMVRTFLFIQTYNIVSLILRFFPEQQLLKEWTLH